MPSFSLVCPSGRHIAHVASIARIAPTSLGIIAAIAGDSRIAPTFDACDADRLRHPLASIIAAIAGDS
jgi:hypothetical protein